MKDPRSGPIAVVVLVLVLLLKLAALEQLAAQQALTPLILTPLLGRTALVALFLTTPYVRPGGLGAVLAQQMPRGASLVALAAVCLVIVVASGVSLLLAAVVSFLFLRWLMLRRLGGTTGDTAGALLEVTETIALVTAAVVNG